MNLSLRLIYQSSINRFFFGGLSQARKRESRREKWFVVKKIVSTTSTSLKLQRLLKHSILSSGLNKRLKLLTRFLPQLLWCLGVKTIHASMSLALACASLLVSGNRSSDRDAFVDKTTLIPTDLSLKWVASALVAHLFAVCCDTSQWRLSDIKSTVPNRLTLFQLSACTAIRVRIIVQACRQALAT